MRRRRSNHLSPSLTRVNDTHSFHMNDQKRKQSKVTLVGKPIQRTKGGKVTMVKHVTKFRNFKEHMISAVTVLR